MAAGSYAGLPPSEEWIRWTMPAGSDVMPLIEERKAKIRAATEAADRLEAERLAREGL